MEQKICLDTDVIIQLLNKRDDGKVARLFEDPAKNLAVSAITAFELRLRTDNHEPVEELLRDLEILPFDGNVSTVSAVISRKLKKNGTPVDYRDVFTAGCCIHFGYSLLTNNRADFTKISELKIYPAQ